MNDTDFIPLDGTLPYDKLHEWAAAAQEQLRQYREENALHEAHIQQLEADLADETRTVERLEQNNAVLRDRAARLSTAYHTLLSGVHKSIESASEDLL